MSIAVFLPTRKGSQRIKNKNTKPFANYSNGLLELKLRQLVQLDVDEIILSTNDEVTIEIVENQFKNSSLIRIDRRADNLASSTTSLSDLIEYVPKITNCEHILWTHVTSPFVDSAIYKKAIESYKKSLTNGFDSLFSVSYFQNFLWDKERKDIINRGDVKLRWPQTQDLKKLYEINSAIFICNRETYEVKKDRVGNNPYLFEMGTIQSLDVDWEEDFKIAEAVYEKLYK